MRTIKFRGYDAVGDKGWVYGDLTHNQKVTREGLEPRTMVGGYEVYPESVCEFTGCVDVLDKEVYEGDVVTLDGCPEHGGRIVVFYEESFCLATDEEYDYLTKGEHPYMNDYAHMDCLHEWSCTGSVRVISNIFEERWSGKRK